MNNSRGKNEEMLEQLEEKLERLQCLFPHASVEDGENLVIRGLRTMENMIHSDISGIKGLMYKNDKIWDEFERYGFHEIRDEHATPNHFQSILSQTINYY